MPISSFSQEQKELLVKVTAKVGNIFKAPLDESNGITPKDGDLFRNKYFAILGVDENYVYGGVVVNSEINKHLTNKQKMYYYPISKRQYPFLDHDSFINCTDIKQVPLSKLANGEYIGDLIKQDCELVTQAIIECGFVSMAVLKQFHILR